MSSTDSLPGIPFLADGGFRSRATARRGVMCWVSTRWATAPLTAAAEKEVPLQVANPPALYRLRTSSPGASRSTHGCLGLKSATLKLSVPAILVPAPTATTFLNAAGHIFFSFGPWLPAAATMMWPGPVSAETVATEIAALPGWRARLVEGRSAVGGGSAPGVELPTSLVVVERDGASPDALEATLRRLDPPIVARIDRDRVVLDLRTVLPEQDAQLARLFASL